MKRERLTHHKIAQGERTERKADTMTGLKNFFSGHPRLLSWLVLAVGMIIMVVWAAKDVGFLPHQWAALIVATILLAGACAWIIGWE